MPLLLIMCVTASWANGGDARVLRGKDGVAAVFERDGDRYRWVGYRDGAAGRDWGIAGPLFSVQTPDGRRTNVGERGFSSFAEGSEGGRPSIVLETELDQPRLGVRQTFSFCDDGRTLRIRSALRAMGDPVVVQRVGLLEIRVAGQTFRRAGPEYVSSPIFGDRIFAGIEHPSAFCQVDGDAVYLAQHSYTHVGPEWVGLPAAVFGSAADGDVAAPGEEAVRRAFLRYLDTVRVRPTDMHVHYNNWWTMPVPFSEQDVLANIADLKQALYDRTGFFFDSYAMDMGWSDPHSVWQIDHERFPEGFDHIRDALAEVRCRPGLWVSPSSLYPPALDNAWLEGAEYEVSPGSGAGRHACIALGGRYQSAFREAVLQHARRAHLAHVKFDGFVPRCDVAAHGHPTGVESFQPLAEGLMDVMDALRAQDPSIVLEPTCFGQYPSPWWLMHTPFILGPFGDDSPRGRCPSPEWIESMTTARDIANLRGRGAFAMPSSALECFDIVVQCPGGFQNHAVMVVGRGRWFLSCYINPRFMDPEEWRFFADLVRWARRNRGFLQDPMPFGGDPAERKPYGYAYLSPARQLFFARNPWIEEASVELPEPPDSAAREMRTLYPRREVVCRTPKGAALPRLRLGPYELLVVEAVPTEQRPSQMRQPASPEVLWRADTPPAFERIVYEDDPPAYGPSWTCPDGDAAQVVVFAGSGELTTDEEEAELCLLVEGRPEVAQSECTVRMDGQEGQVQRSGSAESFSAAGGEPEENWVWFVASVPSGRHDVSFRVVLGDEAARCGAFLRGFARSESRGAAFGRGPQFPLFRPDRSPWSRVLAPLVACDPAATPSRRMWREIMRIDGVYMDALDWIEASAGWGQVQRNRSVMGQPMRMGGRTLRRGLGTHAYSRIVYDVPPGCRRFVATVGCDQEVRGNSIVFVVEGDGRELFRTPLMRYDTPPIEVDVPLAGAKRLALIVEDGGDGIAADHGDWADARLLG